MPCEHQKNNVHKDDAIAWFDPDTLRQIVGRDCWSWESRRSLRCIGVRLLLERMQIESKVVQALK